MLAGVLLAGATARSSAQILRGRVLEAGSNRPIATAAVSVSARGQAPLSTESDSAGGFQLTLARPGWYGVRVDRLGYARAETDSVSVGRGEIVEIAIRLSVTAVPLAPLMVVERRSSRGAPSEFYRRLESGRRTGSGWFITREALDSMNVPSITGILARVPHVGMEYDLRGMARPVMLSQGGCLPTLYVNGALLQLATGESIDDMFNPATLEGIEIYRNRTELPAEFAGPRECGAIILWTRTSEASRGGLWRILTAGGLMLGLVVLLVAS